MKFTAIDAVILVLVLILTIMNVVKNDALAAAIFGAAAGIELRALVVSIYRTQKAK